VAGLDVVTHPRIGLAEPDPDGRAPGILASEVLIDEEGGAEIPRGECAVSGGHQRDGIGGEQDGDDERHGSRVAGDRKRNKFAPRLPGRGETHIRAHGHVAVAVNAHVYVYAHVYVDVDVDLDVDVDVDVNCDGDVAVAGI